MIGSIEISSLDSSGWWVLVIASFIVLVIIGLWGISSSGYASDAANGAAIVAVVLAFVGVFGGLFLVDASEGANKDARIAAVEQELGGKLVEGDVRDGGFLVVEKPDGSVLAVNSAITGDTMVFFEGSGND